MSENGFEGMNPKYYKGLQSVSSCQPEDLLEWDKLFQGSGSPNSSSSSKTAEVFPTQQEGAGAVQNPVAAQQDHLGPMDRPLPIRRRQRKPDRRNKTVVQAEALPLSAPAHKQKQGRNPKGRGGKPKAVARTSKAGQGASGNRELNAEPPVNPPELQELPSRKKTPKKMWPEEEATLVSRRPRGHAQAEEEEDNTEDYTPSPIAFRGTRQAQEGRPRHSKKEKKKGGPCAKCHVTRAVTWRRGAQGRAYAGQPLCNRCGVWESRHPDSDEEGLQRSVGGRRRVYRARGVARHAKANSPSQAESDTCMATAVDTATAAEALPPTSEVQRWQSNNGFVARVPTAAQSSGMQFLAKQGYADARAGDSVCSGGAGVQGGQGGGAKMSRKRLAEISTAQPAGKRWKIESFPGSLPNSMGQQNSPWETANVAGLGCSIRSSKDGQERSDGGMVFYTKPVGLSVMSGAAVSQQQEGREESGHV